jgi:S1-C subfamily serine protease
MSVLPLTEDIQNQLGLPKRSGDLVVAQVQKGSPADLAGLKPGDVITAVNGKKVDSLVEFYRAMNAGKEPAFRIERQGRSLIIGLVK